MHGLSKEKWIKMLPRSDLITVGPSVCECDRNALRAQILENRNKLGSGGSFNVGSSMDWMDWNIG